MCTPTQIMRYDMGLLMASDQKSSHSLQFKLFPLPYFSLQQAANQIGVSIEYIEEAIVCGLIRPCVLLDSRAPCQSSSCVVGCEVVLGNVEVVEPELIAGDNVIGVSPFQKLMLSNIDELISSNASQAVVTGYEAHGTGIGEVSAYLHGFWQITSNEEAAKMLNIEGDEELMVEVLPYVDECWYQELEAETGEVRVTGFLVNARREQLVISYLDTYRMLEAYHLAKPMTQLGLYGETQLTPERKPRKPADQALAMICGLVASHPELGADLLNKPSELHHRVEHLFARKGISLNSYFPNLRSLLRWLKGGYKDKLTL